MPDNSSGSSSGSEGSQALLRVDQERQLRARRLAILFAVSTKADCRGQLQFFTVDFLTNWFVASMNFRVDDGIVVVAADDDATVSLITYVSMVQQIERLFTLTNSISLSADFDGQMPSEQTTALPNHVLRGDWSSAEHVTSARFVRHGRVARWSRHVPRDW